MLNPFLDSKGFDSITDTLIRLVEQDRRFTPKLKGGSGLNLDHDLVFPLPKLTYSILAA